MPEWLSNLLPIVILLAVVGVVIGRLPTVDGVDHSPAFRRRRVMNWLPLGLAYAFLYMGRYNLKVSQYTLEEIPNPTGAPLMGNADFSWIFAVGTGVYAVSFLINGPLTDAFGGKRSILAGTGGAAVANVLMGLATWSVVHHVGPWEFVASNFVTLFAVLYGANMYFQSFGAVAVVKGNAPWFHLRERGVFGAIFGILIALGIYFAYDWGRLIVDHLPLQWVFLIPSAILVVFFAIIVVVVKDTPGEAGFADFAVGDVGDHDTGERLPALKVFGMMLRNPAIMTIAWIEFCSGFLRQAIMQWYPTFAKQTDAVTGLKHAFVYDNWGLLQCCAGIMGGVVAGIISDHLFQSRRGPVAGFLYFSLLSLAIVMTLTYQNPAVIGWVVIGISMSVIGVHGMLSGTASMDFGGKKNVGIAVGIIDGFVYLGSTVMGVVYGYILPEVTIGEGGAMSGPATDPANWWKWPVSLIPVALLGLALSATLWNARPQVKAAGGH